MTIAPPKCATQVRRPSAPPKCADHARRALGPLVPLRLPAHAATFPLGPFVPFLISFIPLYARDAPRRTPLRESGRPPPVPDMSEKPASAYLEEISRALGQGGGPM